MKRVFWWSVAIIALPQLGWGVLVFDDGRPMRVYVWRDNSKVFYRKCTTEAPTLTLLSQFTKTLKPQCLADRTAQTSEISAAAYYRSVGALFGIKTAQLNGNTPEEITTELAVQEELLHRGARTSTEVTFERLIRAVDIILESLEPDNARLVIKGDPDYDSLIHTSRQAMAHIFSDGTTALMTGYRAKPSNMLSACPPGWGTMSLISGLRILGESGAAFTSWHVKSTGRTPTILTWNQWYEVKRARDGNLGQVSHSNAFVMSFSEESTRWAAAQPSDWYRNLNPLTPSAELPGYHERFIAGAQATDYPVLCLRRQHPHFHQINRPNPGALTLESLAARYEENSAVFLSKVLVDPEIEKGLAPLFIFSNTMDDDTWHKTLQEKVDRLLIPPYPEYSVLEKLAIAREKEAAAFAAQRAKEEKERQENERHLAQQREANERRLAQARAAQAEAERRAQAQREYDEKQRKAQAVAAQNARTDQLIAEIKAALVQLNGGRPIANTNFGGGGSSNGTAVYARRYRDQRAYYQSNDGRITTKAVYDQQMNTYNLWKYGHTYHDAGGNPIPYEEYLQLR